MKRTLLSLLLFPGAVTLLQPVVAARGQTASYDPTADFSITNGNPNGVWSYGWMPVGFGTLNLLTKTQPTPIWNGWNGDGTPCIWQNQGAESYGVPTGWLSLHPGPGQEPIVLRWTSPTNAPIRVKGRFLPGDAGSMQVAVRLDGQPWWGATDSGAFALQTNVVVGTTIDFTVYGGYGYGNTPLGALLSVMVPAQLYLESDGQNNTVTFVAPTAGTYTLQFTPDLKAPAPWTALTTNALSANQFFNFTEAATSRAGYYRMQRN